MKIFLMILSLSTITFSSQAMAGFSDIPASVQPSVLTTLLPINLTGLTAMTSSGYNGKEAELVLQDGQEYFQSGVMTPFMAEKINALQSTQELSDDEAVDMLMNKALEILK